MFYYNGDKEDLLKMIHNLMNPDSFYNTVQKGSTSTPRGEQEKKCPQCGTTSSELFKNGKIGCTACVETFHEELENILNHIQGRNRFSGRITKELIEEKVFDLEETKEKLALAVKEERYEDAAVYRDQIREHAAEMS